jgi:hypothetical protein
MGYIPSVLKALGLPSNKARQLAKDTLKKEKMHGHTSEHDVYKNDSKSSGFERASGETEDTDVALKRKEAVLSLISDVKDEFEGKPDALKVLSVNLIQHGFDEIIPTSKIPHYEEISKLLRKADEEAGKRGKVRGKSTSLAIVTGKPEDGCLGIPARTYYSVMDYLKSRAKSLTYSNESFMSGLSSLFGGSSEFKLSNLEPMEQIIKRDINNYKYKGYGLHLQGVTTEEGEDMLQGIPAVKHQYQGDALIIPLESGTNFKKVLKKAIPGKRVILFGYDTKPQPLRKGWEGFQYKLVHNPTVIGTYSLSPETKSESILKMLSEGFQCEHYDHANLACSKNRPCDWKGFPSVDIDNSMKRECLDYR